MGDLYKLFEKTCVNELTGAYANYKNCFLPTRYEKFAKEIDEMEVYDTDIWVTSFPKTGTTWTQEMVYLLSHDCNFEKGQSFLYERFPFLE